MNKLIFGRTWEEISDAQQKRLVRKYVNLHAVGDYGCDPMGDGMFRMVPSGDVVDATERDRRLS